MQSRFIEHIETHLSFLKGARLLVACSGGLDSVVLVQLLKNASFTIGIAHCNFSLRGLESDGDETFVENLSSNIEVPFYSETFDTKTFAETHQLSTQMAARELRYQWFYNLLKTENFDYILTGHHADDSLETFLINLSRGTGLKGLLGIPEANNKIVRPLLPFSRADIKEYAKKQELYWREDSSNRKDEYLRNNIRHNVIPKFKEVDPSLLGSVQKTQFHLRDSAALIDDYMALIYNLIVSEKEDGYAINVIKLNELPNSKALLYELLHPFGFTDFTAILDILNGLSGKQVFSKTHRLLKNRDELLLFEHKVVNEEIISEKIIKENEFQIALPIPLSIIPTEKIGNIDTTSIYVDKDKITYPLVIRKYREGDVFQPFGMKGKKKISKFFKDEKLSLAAKEKTWLLCDAQSVVWVIGLRADQRFKVTSETKQILKISTTYAL